MLGRYSVPKFSNSGKQRKWLKSIQSGASTWTTAQRQTFANDLTHPQLLAVTDNVNESKGDSGPEDWKPPLSKLLFSHACILEEAVKADLVIQHHTGAHMQRCGLKLSRFTIWPSPRQRRQPWQLCWTHARQESLLWTCLGESKLWFS
jgi:hypothetical protein